jgi:arylsulfatase A-like enzyme
MPKSPGSVRERSVLARASAMLAAACIGSVVCLAAGSESVESQPNIVLFLADDLGYGELGCQGNSQVPTPHIDSLANDGVRFTNGYVSAAYCSASRAGLMTGRYQTRFGYEFNPIGAQNDDPNVGLPGSELTLAEHLHSVGYATALIGKWHLGGTAKYHPLRRGFDEFFGFLHEGHFYVPPPYRGVTSMLRRRTLPGGGQGRFRDDDLILSSHMRHDEPPYDANNPILRGGQPVEESAYLTDAFTREAVDFIQRNQRQPFFLYLAYNAVHSPLQAPHSYMKRFSHIEDVHRRIFAAMLANLDDSVGTVMNELARCGLSDNTLVFFLSDNGGPTRELTSSNRPLRGEKGDAYEGGIRVPFIVNWPRHLPSGRLEHRPVISLDIFATASAVSGAVLPRQSRLDGVDLMPFLTQPGTERPHEMLFWRLRQRSAVRVGDWKLVRNPGWGKADAGWELYNLAEDIGEEHDQADVERERFSQLMSVWKKLDQEMSDPFWPVKE